MADYTTAFCPAASGRGIKKCNEQWYDHDNYWHGTFDQVENIDERITEFNDRVGLL